MIRYIGRLQEWSMEHSMELLSTRFEVLTVVMTIQVFWDVTPCKLINS